MKPCVLFSFETLFAFSYYFRSTKSRLMFNPTQGFEWQQCMDTCPKLRRARPPTFINMEDMEEFFRWPTITTKDPSTLVYYPDVDSEAFWLPIRQVGTHILHMRSCQFFMVTSDISPELISCAIGLRF